MKKSIKNIDKSKKIIKLLYVLERITLCDYQKELLLENSFCATISSRFVPF